MGKGRGRDATAAHILSIIVLARIGAMAYRAPAPTAAGKAKQAQCRRARRTQSPGQPSSAASNSAGAHAEPRHGELLYVRGGFSALEPSSLGRSQQRA